MTSQALPDRTAGGGLAARQRWMRTQRGFVHQNPADGLLLDEPTASLDERNRDVVTEMIREERARGTALLGIFHDAEVRGAVADRVVTVGLFSAAAAAAV